MIVVIMKQPVKSYVLLSLVVLVVRSMYVLIYIQANKIPVYILFLLQLFFMNVLTSSISFMNHMASRTEPLKLKEFTIGFTLPSQLIMFTIDSILYAIIVWYVMKVFPNPCLEAKKWWFLVDMRRPFKGDDMAGKAINRAFIEYCSSEKKEALNCNRICKIINNKIVVSNVTVKSYEGEITMLMGHKGAGQAITINMLGGLIKPTSGRIRVYGYDFNSTTARSKVSMCPTQNSFFQLLTPYEYIKLICQVRGLAYGDIIKELNKWMETSKFNFHVPIGSLSFDHQRILALTCCLCLDSRLIVMYLPTLHMTPKAKIHFWNMMKKELAGRSFIIATHNLEEAIQLGNRIAMMSYGTIRCYGSPYFLRKRMVDGYRLVRK